MLIDPADDVVVAIEPIDKGEIVEYVCNGEAFSSPLWRILRSITKSRGVTFPPVSLSPSTVSTSEWQPATSKRVRMFMCTTYPATGKIWAEEERQYDILWL